MEMLFLWLEQVRLDQIVQLNHKKFLPPQKSLDALKKAGKPRQGVSPSTVKVSSPSMK